MTARLLRLLALAAAGAAAPGQAAPVKLFSTEAAFQAAAVGSSLAFEGFDQTLQQTGQTDRRFGDIRVTSPRFTVSTEAKFVSDGSSAIKAVPGGWGDYGPVTFDFAAPVNFLGLDLADLGTSKGKSSLMARLDDGKWFELASQGTTWPAVRCEGEPSGDGCYNNEFEGSVLFAGLYSGAGFSSITFAIEDRHNGRGASVLDDYVGFDRFRYGAGALAEARIAQIPEPSSVALLVLALAALGIARRRFLS